MSEPRTHRLLIALTAVAAATLYPLSELRFKGLGDIQEQVFFRLAKPKAVIWGIGPIFSVPTAITALAHTGKWALVPNAVVLRVTGPWVFGMLISQLWTIAEADELTPTSTPSQSSRSSTTTWPTAGQS